MSELPQARIPRRTLLRMGIGDLALSPLLAARAGATTPASRVRLGATRPPPPDGSRRAARSTSASPAAAPHPRLTRRSSRT